MPWMHITCGQCGHKANLESWTSTPFNGELPQGTYQCPNCRYAFKRQAEQGTTFPSGLYIPGKITLVPVPAWL